MPWPTPQEYNEAIQSPALCFSDVELRAGTVETTALGLPRPITGNFASVYHLSSGGRDWALRCFWRDFADLQSRYAAISAHLASVALPYIVPFGYLERGIRVRGTWYPLLKMEWAPGALLDRYVEANLGDGASLRALAASWVKMCSALERARVAHGDLQHGNVLVCGGRLVLVDYDGMYVPALSGRTSHETGHPNYQHPGRTGADFAPSLDRFSAWSIYLSLRAVAGQPELWAQLGGGDECLLLRAADYRDPEHSRAFAALLTHPDAEVVDITESLRSFLRRSPGALPPLQAPHTGSAPSVVQGIEYRVPRPVASAARRLLPSAPSDVLSLDPPRPAGPDWLADHLVPPTLGVTFAPPVSGVRLTLIAVGCAIVLVVAVAVFDSAWLVGAMLTVVGLMLAAAVVPVGAYRRTETVLHLREGLALVSDVERESAAVLADLAAWEDERCRRADLFDRELAKVAGERVDLADGERREREELRLAWEARAADIDAEQRRNTEVEATALASALGAIQARHIRDVLRHEGLRSAQISGVGWTAKLRLYTLGIWAAADLTAEKIRSIGGLDEDELLALVTWRVECERAARRSSPSVLPAPVEASITQRHARTRETLDGRRRAFEARWKADDAAAAATYAEALAALRDDETALLAERDASLSECDEELAELRVELPRLVARRTEALRGVYPYRDVSFRRYLRVVAGRE